MVGVRSTPVTGERRKRHASAFFPCDRMGPAGVMPGPGEPTAGPWREEHLDAVVQHLRGQAGQPVGRPLIVAIDGRGGAGKTMLAERLRAAVPLSEVLHSDDLAWHHSFFGWEELLTEVLLPIRHGKAAEFFPPAWHRLGRKGSICIPSGLQIVWVEGTGTSRTSLFHLLDASIWVQSDQAAAAQRLVLRDGAKAEVLRQEWQRQEVQFLLEDQPWYRADVILAGTPVGGLTRENVLNVANGLGAGGQ